MQAATVNLDAEQLLETNVAQVHLSAEVREKRELAVLIRRFEDDGAMAKSIDQPVGERLLQHTVDIKQPNAPRAFSSFDHQLNCARI